MNNLKTTIIQSDLHWENKAANLNMFSQKIDQISELTDLIILPEMFTTGFSMNPEKLSEKMNGETIAWMKEKAAQKKCVLAGSFICEENNHYYNRFIWMQADGTYNTYDKRHLFRMADEHEKYTEGKNKLIVELKGWKICPLICYDLRFPVWSRNKNRNSPFQPVNATYDVVIYIANWPKKRSHAWKTLLLARAIENQCYVVGVNRLGMDGNQISYSGDSAAINPKGEVISTLKTNEEKAETVELNFEELNEFRKEFPVLLDADDFTLTI